MHSQVASKWAQGSVCAAFGAGLFWGRCLFVSTQIRQPAGSTYQDEEGWQRGPLACNRPAISSSPGRLRQACVTCHTGAQQASARGSQLTLAFEDSASGLARGDMLVFKMHHCANG